MLDDLRGEASEGLFDDEDVEFDEEGDFDEEGVRLRGMNESRDNFLGMTAAQRFVLAVLLLLLASVLSCLILLVTEKVML